MHKNLFLCGETDFFFCKGETKEGCVTFQGAPSWITGGRRALAEVKHGPLQHILKGVCFLFTE